MAEKKHSELSPSNGERWWNCPGSVAACRGLKGTTSVDAQDGIAAHAVLELCLKNKQNPFDMVGMEIEEVEVTEEMAEAVSFAIDEVNAELQKGGVLFCEQNVEIVKGVISGTLDICIVRVFDRVVIMDFKYGKGVIVKAQDNKQLLMYALPKLLENDCASAELVIIQPRVMTEEKVTRWECSLEYMLNFQAELFRHIELTKEANALTIPGDHCRWCLAKAMCPELRTDLSQSLTPVQNKELIFPEAKTLTMEVITKVLDYRDRIEDWLNAVSMYAFSILENGGTLPGYELAKKRSHRIWKDEKEVALKFAELGEKLVTTKLVSPTQLEKLVGKDRKKEIESLTIKPDNGLTLKRSGEKK